MNNLTKEERNTLMKKAKEIIGVTHFTVVDNVEIETKIFDFIISHCEDVRGVSEYYKVKIIDGKIYFPKFLDYAGAVSDYDPYILTHYHDKPWMPRSIERISGLYGIPFAKSTDPMYCKCMTNRVTVSKTGVCCVNCGNKWDFPHQEIE